MESVDLLKIERASSPDDPERCQGMTTMGGGAQCPNKGAYLPEGGRYKYCRMHGGAIPQRVQLKEQARNYRLGQWQARVEQFADNDQVKSLREEIGITRMLLEEQFNRVTDSSDLLINSRQINDLVARIERLVVSCHKIENSMGELLDKNQLIQFATEIVNIVTTNVTDENVIRIVGDQIFDLIARTGKEEAI